MSDGGSSNDRPTPAADPPRGNRLPRSARREQLLWAAQELFVAHGYHGASMDEIAERAGVSKPVLYQHFPSKMELYLALLDTQSEALIQAVRAALAATTVNRLRVNTAVAAYFDFVDTKSEAFRLLFESDLRSDPIVWERVREFIRSCVEAVATTISADTGFSPAKSELLAAGLTGMAEISARWWLEHRDDFDKAEAVATVSALGWRGMAGFPLQSSASPTA